MVLKGFQSGFNRAPMTATPPPELSLGISYWVSESSLAGFVGAFMRSGRPRGPRKAGGFAPYILEGFPEPPGQARHHKCTQQIRPDCLQIPSLKKGGL